MSFDYNSHFQKYAARFVAPPTPIRKRRSMNFEGSVIVRGRTPAPAATRTAEYSPRKRSRRDTDEFEMPPACRVVGNKLLFPLDHEVGDVSIMREPNKMVKVKWRVTRGDRRRVRIINREVRDVSMEEPGLEVEMAVRDADMQEPWIDVEEEEGAEDADMQEPRIDVEGEEDVDMEVQRIDVEEDAEDADMQGPRIDMEEEEDAEDVDMEVQRMDVEEDAEDADMQEPMINVEEVEDAEDIDMEVQRIDVEEVEEAEDADMEVQRIDVEEEEGAEDADMQEPRMDVEEEDAEDPEVRRMDVDEPVGIVLMEGYWETGEELVSKMISTCP